MNKIRGAKSSTFAVNVGLLCQTFSKIILLSDSTYEMTFVLLVHLLVVKIFVVYFYSRIKHLYIMYQKYINIHP